MEQAFKDWKLQLFISRSMRYSIVSNQPTIQNVEKKRESILNADLPPTKITNVETLVERLIQDTFFEAFQEYFMLQNKSETGKINLAYEITEEDDVVTLRRKCKPSVKENGTLKARSLSEISIKASRSSTDGSKSSCVHKKSTKGTSADIWALIINTLVCRGFEVVAPDMIGHGFSSAPDKPSCYNFNNLLHQALTIFDYYMTDEKRKCILIGHSYG
ncbi:hypothetical protein NQ314_012536 [Rhamnusium bicolor]|uniref:AB hydrolase-1 domain-containing protein n=1 Tax=Rhamnusium bicolor TaxID=1586634 RepID=A0AAV8XC32_9CUCU|nr:hypothetical protein NQ314_012536 [Rhamnusium bicolor]